MLISRFFSLRAPRLLVALLMMSFAGCSDEKPPETPGTLRYTENARAAYREAMEAYLNRDWEEAAELFEDVKRRYGQSRYAKLADLRLADIAFEQDKLAEAVSSYKSFVQSYRHDAGVPYARYRVCRALFLQISDSILLPPQEERDQAITMDAYRELRRFRKEVPKSQWAEEVDYMMEAVTGRLVRHELYVARFYLKRDNFKAAVARIQFALRNFEGSGLEAEAMVLLGETYLKMKKRKQARETFERLLVMHPGSAFTLVARSFLKEIDAAHR